MKIKKITDAVGNIDDDLICDGDSIRINTKKKPYLKWILISSAILVVIIIAIALPIALNKEQPSKIDNNGFDRNYIDEVNSIFFNDSYHEWPWDKKTDDERYTQVQYNELSYHSSKQKIDKQYIGEKLGACIGFGYDDSNGEKREKELIAYKILDVSYEISIAINFDGDYYVYTENRYKKEVPKTLGELLNTYNLSNVLELKKFSYKSLDSKEEKYLELINDEYIWQVLSNHKDLPIEITYTSLKANNQIAFTATSQKLGIYKKVLNIYDDGYITTNIFEYNYCINVGEEVTKDIITYAKNNSKQSEFEPYYNYKKVVGELKTIQDNYVIIDDTQVCKNPKDGMEFRVSLDNQKIKREMNNLGGRIKIGDYIVVFFDDELKENNIIDSAILLNKVDIIDNGKIIIYE